MKKIQLVLFSIFLSTSIFAELPADLEPASVKTIITNEAMSIEDSDGKCWKFDHIIPANHVMSGYNADTDIEQALKILDRPGATVTLIDKSQIDFYHQTQYAKGVGIAYYKIESDHDEIEQESEWKCDLAIKRPEDPRKN